MAKVIFNVVYRIAGLLHIKENKGVEHVLEPGATHEAEATDPQVKQLVEAGALVAKPVVAPAVPPVKP